MIRSEDDGTAVLYIDRHLVHEVTSPQAFEGLDLAGRKVWRVSANLRVSDHNVPTTDRSHGIADPISKLQVDTLDANCDRVGITQFKMNDRRQGIVHVIGPGAGRDAARHDGRLRRLAHPPRTAPSAHSRTASARARSSMCWRRRRCWRARPRTCSCGSTASFRAAAARRTSCSPSSAGSEQRAAPATRSSSPVPRSARSAWKGRMTVCNMAIEAGARAGLVAVDETTIAYLRGRPFSPSGLEWKLAEDLLAHASLGCRRALGSRRRIRRR